MNFLINFYEKYLDINLLDYENINFNLEISKVILFLAIALCIGFVGLYRHQANVSLLFKRLLKLDAFGSGKARSLKELKLADSKAFRRLVTNREGYLKKCLYYVGEAHPYEEEGADEAHGQKSSQPEAHAAENLGKDTVTPEACADFSAEKAENEDREEAISLKEGRSSALEAEGNRELTEAIKESNELCAAANDNRNANSDADTSEAFLKSEGVLFLSDGLISPDAKIYVPEDKWDFVRHILDKSNSSIPRLVLSCILVVGISAALILAMPEILPALNNLLAP